MTLDNDLRAALSDRADAERSAGSGALGEIHHRVKRAHRRRQAALGGGAVVLVLALVAGVLIVNRDRDRSNDLVLSPGDPTTSIDDGGITTLAPQIPPTTSVEPRATVPAPNTTVTNKPPPTGPSTTVPLNPTGAYLWPSPNRDAGSSPAEVALDFAKVFGGMQAPIVVKENVVYSAAFVDIKALPTSSTLTQVGLIKVEGRWMVDAVQGASILVDAPTKGQNISSPVRVAGRCNTFEGHVNIQVRRQFGTTALGEGFGTGMMGELGPYEASVPYQGTGAGVVVVSEPRADTDTAGPLQFTAVLVTL